MPSAISQLPPLKRASYFEAMHEQKAHGWSLGKLEGQLVELSGSSGSSALSLCFDLLLQAQNKGEPVAWLSTQSSVFFPPDAHANGIDLEALPVLRLANHQALGTALEHLLRSGAFSLLVVDWAEGRELSLPMQTRLASLAKKYATSVVFITKKTPELASLGSLISLRAHTHYLHCGEDHFLCELQVLKNKRQSPGEIHQLFLNAPEGLL